MTTSFDRAVELARITHSTLLQRMRDDTTQAAIGKALGVNKSTVNRLINVHAKPLLVLMALNNLKAVDADAQFLDPEDLAALTKLAGHGLGKFGPGQAA